MKSDNSYIPTVLDFAYEVINLHEENSRLKGEVSHYKKLHEIHIKSMNDSLKNNNEMTGLIFTALLDPKSDINNASISGRG